MTHATASINAAVSAPTKATRIKAFASFFKSYMSVWTIIVAALPIPVAAFKLIPTFEEQRKYFSVYTSLFCFLSLAFVFFLRHRIGYYMFTQVGEQSFRHFFHKLMRLLLELLPLIFIGLSVAGVFAYTNIFEQAIKLAQAEAISGGNGALMTALSSDMTDVNFVEQVLIADRILYENKMTAAVVTVKKDKELQFAIVQEAKAKAERFQKSEWVDVRTIAQQYLQKGHAEASDLQYLEAQNFVGTAMQVPTPDAVLSAKQVPLSKALIGWYLTIFVGAETAFILMALREYLQDLAGLSDLYLIGRSQDQAV